eukprot:scaffold219340_cov16-Tisochrysis_lutea.AAC.1
MAAHCVQSLRTFLTLLTRCGVCWRPWHQAGWSQVPSAGSWMRRLVSDSEESGQIRRQAPSAGIWKRAFSN